MRKGCPDFLLAIVGLFNPAKLFIFYMIMFIVSFSEIHGVQVIYGLIQNSEYKTIDYVVFGKWLFVISTPIIITGRFFEICKWIEVFVRIRMPHINAYRLYLLIGCEIVYFLCGISLCVGAMFIDDMWRGIQLITVLIPNYLLWGSVQTLLYVYLNNKKSVVILIGIISGTCLYALHKPEIARYMPAIWGMINNQETMQEQMAKGMNSILFCVLTSLFCVMRKE